MHILMEFFYGTVSSIKPTFDSPHVARLQIAEHDDLTILRQTIPNGFLKWHNGRSPRPVCFLSD